jgi:hypothetical protein
MKAHELAKKLLAGEDIYVMFQDPNSSGGPFGITNTRLRTSKKDEFPEDFDMPEGFKYIELTN